MSSKQVPILFFLFIWPWAALGIGDETNPAQLADEYNRMRASLDEQVSGVSQTTAVQAQYAPLETLRKKARVMMENGKYKKSAEYLFQAEEIVQKQIDATGSAEDLPSYQELKLEAARIQAALGALQARQLDYAQARSHYSAALKFVPENDIPKYILARAEYLDRMGWLQYKLGDYEGAQENLRQAFDLRNQYLDESAPAYHEAYNHLAEVLRETGRYDDAESLYRQLIDNLELALDEAEEYKQINILRLYLADVLNNMGQLHAERQANYTQAEQFYQTALDIRIELLGEHSIETSESRNNLATLKYLQGRYQEAESLYEQVVAIKRSILSPTHPSLALSLHNLGAVYAKLKKHEKARKVYIEALKINKKKLGKQHPYVAATYDQIAQLYQAQGKVKNAEKRYKSALKIRKDTLPANHPDIAVSCNNLGRLYYNQADYAQAITLFQQTVEIMEAAKGEEHPETFEARSYLAYAYAKQAQAFGRKHYWQKAAEYAETAISTYPGGDKDFTDAMERYKQKAYEKLEVP